MNSKTLFLTSITFLFLNCNYTGEKDITLSEELTSIVYLKNNYDTLIPIIGGLLLTYSNTDSTNFVNHNRNYNKGKTNLDVGHEFPFDNNVKKWGVIDSLGNVVVPFICDGVKAISDNQGVVSINLGYSSLPSSIIRYKYFGMTYLFTKDGIIANSNKEFNIDIDFFPDELYKDIIISDPTYFLPSEIRNNSK